MYFVQYIHTRNTRAHTHTHTHTHTHIHVTLDTLTCIKSSPWGASKSSPTTTSSTCVDKERR